MKRIAVVVIINLILCVNGKGQNLVPNSSFEDTAHCPSAFGQISYAQYWTGLGSSDYFNSCADSVTRVSVPYNICGYQMARTGNGYAGFYNYGDGQNVREYVKVQLDSILKSQHRYCVEFYVSLADIGNEACNNIGVYFSDTAITGSAIISPPLFSLSPQINNNPLTNPLTDKINWTKISGSMVAVGGENYMIIGNFNNDANSDTVHLHSGRNTAPYYYIDDISVEDCTNGLGITELTKENEIAISPNPATTSISITSTNNIKEIKLINLLGEEVIITNYQLRITNAVTMDISSVSKGIYFVEITDAKDNVINRKVVVQ